MTLNKVASRAERIGVVGATLSALCCLGTPVIVSLLAAVGLSFLINDAVLIPLLIGSLVLVMWGFAAGWKRHHRMMVLIVGAVAVLFLVAVSIIAPSRPMAYASIAALIGASILNALLSRHAAHEPLPAH